MAEKPIIEKPGKSTKLILCGSVAGLSPNIGFPYRIPLSGICGVNLSKKVNFMSEIEGPQYKFPLSWRYCGRLLQP